MKPYTRYFLSTMICLLPLMTQAQNREQQTAAKQWQQQQLTFIENKGQVVDQHGHHRDDIDYKMAGGGVNVFIGKGGLHYQFNRAVKNGATSNAFHLDSLVQRSVKAASYRMDVTLVGANKHAKVVIGKQQDYYETYYLPQCYGKVAHSYNKITYKDVYPHIDWVLYIKNNRLEYDFVIHPGGNPDDIQLRYDGATGLQNKNNNIIAQTPFGKVAEQKLYVYDQSSSQPIAANFTLQKNTVGFHFAAYNGTVVIDPTLVWGTYYGGDKMDEINGVVSIDGDNVYAMGRTYSSNNIASTGSYQDTIGGGIDILLVRFNSAGKRLWSTYYGGEADEWPGTVDLSRHISFGNHCVAVSHLGYLYITGSTFSNTGMATMGSFQNTMGGKQDAFLAKFNNSGSLIWGTYFGKSETTLGLSVTCDASDNCYISGYTNSDSLATSGSFKKYIGGALNDAFLAKFNSSGSRIWCTYYGGNGDDEGDDMVLDTKGDIYLLGTTASDTGIATANSFQDTLAVNFSSIREDAFLVKFDTSGNRIWGTYYGNLGGEEARSVTCDGFNNIYLVSKSNSLGLATRGSYETSLHGYNSSIIAKFNSSGKRLWASYFNNISSPNTILGVDITGCLYVATLFENSWGPMPDKIYKFEPYGRSLLDSVNYGPYITGGLTPFGFFVNPVVDGDIYICGSTGSPDSIATVGAFDTSLDAVSSIYMDIADGFLAKFHMGDTSVIISQNFKDTLICKGGSFLLPYLINNQFWSGNVFTAQLSDAWGNFSSPVNIGSVTSTTAGNISCTIPSGTAVGLGYRIRVVASSPVYTSPDNGFDITIASSLNPVSIHSNSPLCAGDTLVLWANSSTGAFYSWTGPVGFTSSLQDPKIIPFMAANAGKYYVTASAPGCPSRQDSTMVTVKPVVTPSVSISITPDTGFAYGIPFTFHANALNVGVNPVYKWYINGVLVDSGTAYRSLYTDSVKAGDVVKVVVESDDPCSVPATVTASTFPLGLQQVSKDKSLVLYPNPNNGSFVIKGTLPDITANHATLEITNVLGQVVYHQQVKVSRGQLQQHIQLNRNLPAGIYLLKVQTNRGANELSFSVTR